MTQNTNPQAANSPAVVHSASLARPELSGEAAFLFSNVADATCSPLRGATAQPSHLHSDPVVFNSLLQKFAADRSRGNEQPAASYVAGAGNEFNQGVV